MFALQVGNHFNPFAGFMNATYILKSPKPVSQEAIEAVMGPQDNGPLAHRLGRPEDGVREGGSSNSGETSCDSSLPPPAAAAAAAEGTGREETNSHDIYLLPPGEDPATCGTWLRMRSRDGRYSLMFEEWVTDGPFIISPRIYFEVGVRVLGGLLALGYKIHLIMRRSSRSWSRDGLELKTVRIEGLEPACFVQVSMWHARM